MQGYNMFDVAYRELELDPEVAKKILEIFGIGGREINGLFVIESVDDWIARVVNKMKQDVRDSIIGNSQLRDYLSGVVEFVNLHPVIMNEHIRSDTKLDNDFIHEEDKRMKKQLYRMPRRGTTNEKFFAGERLCRYANYVDALPPVLTGMSTADIMTNTIRGQAAFGMGFVNPNVFSAQWGGANPKVIEGTLETRFRNGDLDSDLLYGLYKTIFDDFERLGLPIKENDKNTLLGGLEKMRDNEIRLGKLYVMLRTLVDLLEFFKNSCCETLILPREISIHDIKSRQEVIGFLKKAVCDMEDCISKNSQTQNSVCNNLVRHFGTLFQSLAAQ
jgi:hypothetical protein